MVVSTRFNSGEKLERLRCMLDDLLSLPLQMIITGPIEAEHKEWLLTKTESYPDKLHVHPGEEPNFERQVFAGADFLFVPCCEASCGVRHLAGLRYGALPIVSRDGGFQDAVIPYDENANSGFGFLYQPRNRESMLQTVQEAIDLYHGDRNLWNTLVERALTANFSWNKTAEAYLDIYRNIPSFRW